MSGKVKVAGTWRDSTAPYVKIGGNWKIAKSAWAKVDDNWRSWFLQGGFLDVAQGGENTPPQPTFNTNIASGADNIVTSIAIQPDGKILIGGDFFRFSGVNVGIAGGMVRLNTDGTVDTAFTTNDGTGVNGDVDAIVIQPDDKIVIGGSFTTFNGVTVNYIARLNSDGSLDTAFSTNTGTGAGASVSSIAIQSDGKIVISGVFSTFNGVTVNRIVRLNSDGTRDTTFGASLGSTGQYASSIAIQSDGKILIGGTFTTFNGAAAGRIIRLNSNGTTDTAFTTNTGTGANGVVNSLAIQSDGKIVIGGNFTTFNAVAAIRILRLNSNGSLDTAFTTNTGTGASVSVSSIAIQSDGKIILGGNFITFNGVTVNRIVRLNSDGTSDTAFSANTGTGASGNLFAIAVQSDDKIVIGGNFTTFNGSTVNYIARLKADGTTEAIAGPNNTVSSIAIQSDGKIILGGFFTTFNGVTVNRIVRLNADGTTDTAFTTNAGTGADNTVSSIAIQSDGKIILGGFFTTFNGVTVNRIVRLNSNGSLDTAFTTNTGTGADTPILAIAIQSDGKIVLGGAIAFNGVSVNYIVRLNSDGTRDTAFTTNNGAGASDPIHAIAIQSDGKIVIGGRFVFFDATMPNRIARLNADGTQDTAFTTNAGTGANNQVNAIAIQSDGKIILGGIFITFNGVAAPRMLRLNSDGTRDTAFTTNNGAGASTTVNSIAVQSGGKIILGGIFITFNGVTVNRIVRLNSDGTIDTAFTTNAGTGADNTVNSIAIQSDGKIVLGGIFTTFNGVNRTRLARIGGDIAG